MKDLKKRTILLVLSSAVLIVAVFVLAYAWYTKMNTVSGLDFDVAQWEFNANQQTDDFEVNVYKYANVTDQKAAPGTMGYITVKLSATNSDTDLDYFLYVTKDSMDPEFQKRLFFYTDELCQEEFDYSTKRPMIQNKVISGTLTRGTEKEVTFYWKWLYEYSESEEGQNEPEYEVKRPVYDTTTCGTGDLYTACETVLNARPVYPVAEPTVTYTEAPVESSYATTELFNAAYEEYLEQTVAHVNWVKSRDLYNASWDYAEEHPEEYQEFLEYGEHAAALISQYDNWEAFVSQYTTWITGYRAARAADAVYQGTLAAWQTQEAAFKNGETYQTWEAANEAWDEFDTKVGKNPEAMSSLMNAVVHIVATEQKPESNGSGGGTSP